MRTYDDEMEITVQELHGKRRSLIDPGIGPGPTPSSIRKPMLAHAAHWGGEKSCRC